MIAHLGEPRDQPEPSNDMFEQMLEMQAELQTHAHPAYVDPREITDSAIKVQFIKDMHIAITDELHEALGETTWKPWTKHVVQVNREAYKGELVDAFHFFMNLMLIEDITVEEFFEAYREKHNRNKQRWAQEGGYQGTDKCPRCKRAWDDIRAHSDVTEAQRVSVDLADGTRICLACVDPFNDNFAPSILR